MRKPSWNSGPTGAGASPPPKGFIVPQLNAYQSFDGNCAEAMKFYAGVLDAKLEALMT